MTDAILAFLIAGCFVFLVAIVWLVLWRRDIGKDPPPDPMEYQEPRVFTRIFDGKINSTKEN